jgi:hypothetical protein
LTFAGFRSRWITPCSCAISSACAICSARSTASSTGSAPRVRRCARSSPSTSFQRGQHLGLALEARQPLGIVGERGGQQLDRHLAVEGGVHRLPDDTHPALADLVDQAVVEQLLSGLDGHVAVLPGQFAKPKSTLGHRLDA